MRRAAEREKLAGSLVARIWVVLVLVPVPVLLILLDLDTDDDEEEEEAPPPDASHLDTVALLRAASSAFAAAWNRLKSIVV